VTVLELLIRLWIWNALPNGRRARFYDVWAGRSTNRAAFRRRLHADLGAVFAALAAGRITAPVAAELPLARAGEALRPAESGTVRGKVILTAG
jgi:synaptic vesicle membrane protein VAT-1